MPSARFDEILEHLAAHEVDFILVGMTAAMPILRATLDEREKSG